ncbi:MAG: S9 family peptidase [bacterium]|nr:S9 family peptidase [bacterium]
MHKSSLILLAILLLGAAPGAAETHPFSVHDLVSMDRLSDPQVSPAGDEIVFVRRVTDLEADRGRTDLWEIAVDGGDVHQLTLHEESDSNPRWSSNGSAIYFLSTRSGSSQVWRLPAAGGKAKQVTSLPLDVANLEVSPDGSRIAFTLEVFLDCDSIQCTADRLEKAEQSPETGRIYDRLFVRHWDTLKDGRRSHLFVLQQGAAAPVDLTTGWDADIPSKPFGGSEEFVFSPDGKELVFTARDAGGHEPWSTDFDLYRVPADGSGRPVCLTEENEAWDTQPVFSADGSLLAHLAMERPGFEADRFRVMVREWPDGEARVLTEEWDRSVGGMFFSASGETIFATAGDTGEIRLFAIDVASGKVSKVTDGAHIRSPQQAGNRIVFGMDTMRSPVDLYSVSTDGSNRRRLTDLNAERVAAARVGDFEQFSFEGWNGETVYGYVVQPADFDPRRKYPLALIIHGGPQGSSDNDFHYRWNPQPYAGAGYAVMMIDFHGSTGYGQAFTDSITNDWGGKPLEDLQKGLAAALAKYPWIDGERACALGASYGGYMINWIAGNWPSAFRCLVNHDGIFDQRMMYYATEELWFPEWEHGGPYWRNPDAHERHNPANHVDSWKAPMLVVHGARDYRIPESQGLATFTALQRQGIPSRFLYFPDENHWVLKPSNSVLWHDTVIGWLDRWLGE